MSASASEGLGEAVGALRRGGVIAIPTDTVYGLACDPADAAAVERIYSIKHRPAGLELTVLAASVDDIAGDVELTRQAVRLAARHWPGALSMVLRLRRRRWAVPRTGDTLSVRVPAHPLLLELLRRTGPLATTSANRHGEPPAGSAPEVAATLGSEVDAVLDGGPSPGWASTIIDCTSMPPRLLRAGPVDPGRLLAELETPPADTTKGQRPT